MYSVSNDYLSAILEPMTTQLSFTIGSNSFTEANVAQGSFQITNQCSGETEVRIGQVYIGQLTCTLINTSFTRYSLIGQTITPTFGLLVNGSYETVPLGVFVITSAVNASNGISITAYDNMAFLDAEYDATTVLTGTPETIAAAIGTACGVTIGTTSAEFAAMSNGTQTLTFDSSVSVNTWRDVASALGTVLAAFVTCDRYGGIIFVPYHKAVDYTIPVNQRYAGGWYADYVTRYTEIKVPRINGTYWWGSVGTVTKPPRSGSGLLYTVEGVNPFLQDSDAGTTTVMRILAKLYSNIQYVPFNVNIPCNPMYDLGDVVCFPDGHGDSTKLFCITKFIWTYHAPMQIEGVGTDPNIASNSANNDIASLQNEVNSVSAYFWHDSNGAHISDNANDTTGSNALITATGFSVKDNDTTVAFFGADGISLYGDVYDGQDEAWDKVFSAYTQSGRTHVKLGYNGKILDADASLSSDADYNIDIGGKINIVGTGTSTHGIWLSDRVFLDVNGVYYLSSSGGANLYALNIPNGEAFLGSSSLTTGAVIDCENQNRHARIGVSTTGRIGAYDDGNSQWSFYSDASNRFYANDSQLVPVTKYGSGTSAAIAAGSYVDTTVSFGYTYSSAPTVVACLYGTSTSADFGKITIMANSISTTGFTVRIWNMGSSSVSPGFRWIAVE